MGAGHTSHSPSRHQLGLSLFLHDLLSTVWSGVTLVGGDLRSVILPMMDPETDEYANQQYYDEYSGDYNIS